MVATFGQAKRILARYMGAAALANIGESINQACEELSFTDEWRDLKRTVRLGVYGGYFALPQEYETLNRAAVNGQAVSVHGPEIEFLSCGPGDFDYIPENRAPINGIQDLGKFAVMYAPESGSTLAFFSTVVPSGKVTVTGRTTDGDIVTETVAVNLWASPTDITTKDATAVTHTVAEFSIVDSVVLPDDVSAYVSCYAILDDAFTFTSRMHPSVKVPKFRRYRIPGPSAETGTGYDILAEVRLRFLPLTAEDDPMPFESLLPVQYMLRSLARVAADDIEGSEKFRALAAASIMRRDNITEDRSGPLVLNSLYDGSPGHACTEMWYNT